MIADVAWAKCAPSIHPNPDSDFSIREIVWQSPDNLYTCKLRVVCDVTEEERRIGRVPLVFQRQSWEMATELAGTPVRFGGRNLTVDLSGEIMGTIAEWWADGSDGRLFVAGVEWPMAPDTELDVSTSPPPFQDYIASAPTPPAGWKLGFEVSVRTDGNDLPGRGSTPAEAAIALVQRYLSSVQYYCTCDGAVLQWSNRHQKWCIIDGYCTRAFSGESPEEVQEIQSNYRLR